MISRAIRVTKPVYMAYAKCAIVSGSSHFRVSNNRHPLAAGGKKNFTEEEFGDHTGRLQNYIWTKDEISEKMRTLYRHVRH